MRERRWILMLIAACTLVPSVSHGTETCSDLYDEIQAAGSNADLKTYTTFYRRAERLPDCDAAFRARLGRRVAIRIISEASGAGEQAMLEASLVYHRLWQALDRLGDIAREKHDHAQAARRYQEALDEISDPSLIGAPPNQETIRTIFKKAETAWLFAGTISQVYVETTRNRAGQPAGLASGGVRGVTITKVSIPITFEFDSTCFTEVGAQAATDPAVQLKAKGLPSVNLIGHADPRGADAYNLKLSLARAKSVKGYLLAKTYCPGEVRYDCAAAAVADYGCSNETLIGVDGRGEREPFVPDDPSRYSEEEIFQMSRRVELVR